MSEVRRVADAAGEIDVLVNCAGFAALAPTADTDEAAFDGLFQINVKAPFFLVAALAPKIAARGGGSIINVSTMVASYGQPGIGCLRRVAGCDRAAHQGVGRRIRAAERPRQRGRSRSDVDPGSGRRGWRWPRSLPSTIPLRRVAEVHEMPTSSPSSRPRRPATSTVRSSPSTVAASRSERRTRGGHIPTSNEA